MNIKQHISLILITSVSLSFLVLGCGSSSESPMEMGRFQAEVLQLRPLSDNQEPSLSPQFRLTIASFHQLKNLDTLEGEFFNLIQGGIFRIQISENEVGTSAGFVDGKVPRLRYEVKNHVAIPKDEETALMLSTYYQFDWISQILEEVSSISMDSLRAFGGNIKLLFYPSVEIENLTSGHSQKSVQKTNAAFFPQHFQFLLMPGSRLEDVPVKTNLQVIAHEFGHLVFSYLIGDAPSFGAVKNSIGPILNHHALRGINEGFADFFSYAVTGSSDILGASFGWNPKMTNFRNFSVSQFKYDEIDQETAGSCQGFYCIGTLFAKSLFQASLQDTSTEDWDYSQVGTRSDFWTLLLNRSPLLSKASTSENRAKFLKKVVQALPLMKEKWAQHAVFQKLILDLPQSNEDVLGAFFETFVQSLNHSHSKKRVYEQLSIQFGETGFKNEFKQKCF